VDVSVMMILAREGENARLLAHHRQKWNRFSDWMLPDQQHRHNRRSVHATISAVAIG
jgi:hypothetical protein